MEVQNSYIFLKNPYVKEEKIVRRKEGKTVELTFGKNLHNYIETSFPMIAKVDGYGNIYKKKYSTELQFGKVSCNVEFIITDVDDTTYLDVVVKGKTKSQIVKCLEYIQNTLMTSGVRERYIDIISYDAVSEYYCNKIYPKLNILERNLRKLLFNIYTVNFGSDYYKTTIDGELQDKIKGVINNDSSRSAKEQIKTEYKASTKKEAQEIERLQRFFYSLEYSDIQKLLFTANWTNFDETNKAKFLNEHADLSKLSDEELREAFSKYVPRSDWERFFSEKINISDIRALIEHIRLYRNSVAHFKFFYKEEYEECRKLINRLDSAIIEAIKITEDKDFSDKNAKVLSEIWEKVFVAYTNPLVEKVRKTISTVVGPAFTEILKIVRESTWINQLGDFAENAVLSEDDDLLGG